MSRYQPYPEYKDSGVEWIGEVPAHWRVVRLKWLSQVSSGTDSPFADGEFDLYGANGVIGRTNVASYQTSRVLIGRVGSSGSVNYAVGSYGVSDNCLVVKNSREIQTRVLLYWMLTTDFSADVSSSAQPLLTGSQVKNHRIPLPSYCEQSQIATFLDRETTRIDTLIEKKQRFIELLEEKVLAIAMAEQMYGDGELVRFGELIRKASRPANIHPNDEYVALGLYNRGRGVFKKPQVKGKDLGESDFFRVEEGDLIISGQFAWEGAVTMASNNERGCIVSHRYHAIRGESVATEYLLALLMTNFGTFLLDEASRGSAGRNRPLNMNRLLREKIRRPSREAQDSVVRLIKLKALLDLRVKESIELLKERRAALITAAVTGKIDVRDEAAA